jgi:hypothetical protein
MKSLSGGAFEGLWEQCAKLGPAPIPQDQFVRGWKSLWDLHVHTVHGYSTGNRPPNQLQYILICKFHTKRFSCTLIQNTYTYIHTHTINRHDVITHICRHRHDTDTSVQISMSALLQSQCVHIKLKLRQVDFDCNVSGDTRSHCYSQPVARAFPKIGILKLSNK